jgi:hypothetical protein
MAAAMYRGGGMRDPAEMNSGADALAAAIREVFMKMHPDPKTNEVGRGDISKGFLEVAEHTLTETELDGLMKEVDLDDSGFIDYEEFAGWMMSSSELASELRHKVDTAACGTLDHLISDNELSAKDRESGPTPFIWKSEEGTAQMLWVLLEEPGTSHLATWIGVYIQALIMMGSTIFVVETLEEIKVNADTLQLFHIIEWFCVAQFTVEYFSRVFVSPYRPIDCKPEIPPEMLAECSSEADEKKLTEEWQAKGHVFSYVTQAMNIVDFVAILPAYLGVLFEGSSGGGLAVLRILRMARILRMIKVGSYAENLALVAEGMKRSRTGLLLMVYLVSIFMIIMASLLYQIEGDPTTVDGSPDVFVSIPHTFWCIIVTMTSVGYGDMYPTSDLGRAVTSFIMLAGILTLAVPITLIGNRFNDVWLESKQEKKKKEMVEKMRYDALHHKDAAPEPDKETTNPIADDDNLKEDAAKQAEEDAAELELKKLRTSLHVANIVLADCLAITDDARFQKAMDILGETPGQLEEELEDE